MSLQKCTGTTGFPITLSQNLFNEWPGGYNPADPKVTNQLVVPTDFSVSWSTSTASKSISVNTALSQFQIDVGSSATETTLTYGDATYVCQPILTIVKIQHANLIPNSPATQELIMTFRITSAQTKQSNPSSPDIILLCRPVILSSSTTIGSDFWKAVNTAALNSNTISTNYNPADNFTYDGTTLMPMITYETCIPTRLIGGPNPTKDGATRVRVHVVTQALSIPSTESGSGKCSAVQKFTMPVNGLVNIFGQSGYTNVQFTNGVTADGANNTYPIPTTPISDALTVNLTSANQIGSWQITSGGSVLQSFEYLVPEVFLGKSLSEISGMTRVPAASSTKKAFKCFTIDPTKDVVGDNILIDPTTGESLEQTMNKQALEAAGGDPALAAALAGEAVPNSGILPGDIEEFILILFSTIGGMALLAHLTYVIRLFMIKNYHDAQYQLLYFILLLAFVAGISYFLAVEDKKHINARVKK
jgi:hypothetical protein